MKTITLEEAQKRATQGKLKALKHRIRGAITNHSIACDVDYANAELIVHHWNTYAELVEALELLCSEVGELDKDIGGANMDNAFHAAKSILARANKVEVAE